MAGTKTLSEFIGDGTNSVIERQAVPGAQDIVQLTWETSDITNWTFTTTFQTMVVDTISTIRNTDQNNYTDSIDLGHFPEELISGGLEPFIVDGPQGILNVVFPADMYTGPMIPDKQKNRPIVILGLTWTTDATPAVIGNIRWGIVQLWQPLVSEEGDPILDAAFVPMTL